MTAHGGVTPGRASHPRGAVEPGRTSTLDWIWLLLPYLILVATSLYVWLSDQIGAGELPVIGAAGLGLIGWHTWWALGHRSWLERALVPMAVYYLGLVALNAVLLSTSFGYFALYLTTYPMAFVALPGLWAYAGLVVAGFVPLALPGALDPGGINVLITLAGVVIAGIIGWGIRALESETTARRAAVTALTEANAELEHALAENIELRDRLVSQARESGVATERARLAAEIHDTLAASLAGILSQLEAVEAQGGTARSETEDRLAARVGTSTELARGALRDVRRSIHALRPTALTNSSLPAALTALAEQAERAHRLGVQVHITGEQVPLPQDVEDALVRIAQEAVTNIHRHANADQVHLTLSYLGQRVALDIADDGVGLGSGGQGSAGHGMAIMSERAQALGGTIEIRSGPDGGTTITAMLPVPGQGPSLAHEPPATHQPGGSDD